MPLLWDADAAQIEVYERAGLDPDEPAPMADLARHLGIPVEMHRTPAFPEDGALACVGGEWRIYLRVDVTPQRKKWACAHEIGEWSLRGTASGQLECAANAIAAALIAPRRAFAVASRALGRTNFAGLAAAFTLSETAAALRTGEALGAGLAVVQPGLVRTRGAQSVWPPADTLRGWASSGPPLGVARHRLTDDARRVVLVGKAAA